MYTKYATLLDLMQSSAVLSGDMEVGPKNADSAKAHSHQVTLYSPCLAPEIFKNGGLNMPIMAVESALYATAEERKIGV